MAISAITVIISITLGIVSQICTKYPSLSTTNKTYEDGCAIGPISNKDKIIIGDTPEVRITSQKMILAARSIITTNEV
jgi:hypothetical protein